MENPKYLIRPQDHSVFVLLETGMYEHELAIKLKSSRGGYSYELLTHLGFYPCDDEGLELVRRKHQLYLDWMFWSCRSDGHGGSKGGTMEEYLVLYPERRI